MASTTFDNGASPIAPSREATSSGSSADPSGGHFTEQANGDVESNTLPALPPLSASWRSEPLSPTEREKVSKILKASRDRDLTALRDLATSQGGLVEDEVRRTACTYAPHSAPMQC